MRTIRSVLEYLAANMGTVILVITLLLVAIITLVILDLRRRSKESGGETGSSEDDDTGPSVPLLPDDIGRSFSRALSALRSFVPGSRYRYRIPWFAVVGPCDSGSTRVLTSTGLPRRFGEPPSPDDHRDRLGWCFFDQGVFIDVAGELILRPDGTADEGAWDRFLNRLLRHRPERPLDGVVLTLSMKDLMGTDEDRLTRDGAELFHRLRRAQHVLGVRFPVYVVVTHCDEIRGFDAMVAALPEGLRQDIFGWSNPYTVEAAFSPSWLDEGFASVRRELSRVVTEILALRDDVGDADAVFRFPDRLAALAPAVSTVLTEVFRDSAYHEGFFFRGVYFTGDPESAPAGLLDDADPEVPVEGVSHGTEDPSRRLVFLHRLFQRKIVPERGLARGFTDSILGRNRTIRGIKIALMAIGFVASLTLWLGHRSVSESADGLSVVLREMKLDLVVIGQGDASADESAILRLLTRLARVDADEVRSVFLPTSLGNSVNERVVGSFEIGFASLILPALRDGILLYGRDTLSLVTYVQSLDSVFGSEPPSSEFVDEAEDIYNHLDELTEFLQTVRRFNSLVSPEGEDPLGKFIDIARWYYVDPPLPPGFDDDFRAGSHLYESALTAVDVAPLTADSLPDFVPIALGLSESLADSLYSRLLGDVVRLAESLDAIDRNESIDLGDLRTDVARVRDFFARIDPFWIDTGREALDPDTEAMLDSIPSGAVIANATSFAIDFRATVASSRARGLVRVAEFIQGPAGISLEDLIRVEWTPQGLALTMHPSTARLDAVLDQLLASTFIDPTRSVRRNPGLIDVDSRVVWNSTILARAIEQIRDYRTLTASGLDSLPPSLRFGVRQIVDDSITALVAGAVLRARQYEPGTVIAGRAGKVQELSRRWASFDAAVEQLRIIVAESQSTGAARSIQDEIASAIVLEAGELLDLALGLVEDGQPWEPSNRSMAAWNGDGAAAYAVYPASNPDELEVFLAGEVAGLADIADRYGRRILGYLALSPVEALLQENSAMFGPLTLASIRTWDGIVRSLDEHAGQVAGSPLEEIERFIREDLSATTPAACPAPAHLPAGTRGGYLEAKLARLRALFMRRCQQLALLAIGEEYDSLAVFFNRRVRGRFPFVAPERARQAVDLEPEVARDLFAHFDRLSGLLDGQAVSAVGRVPAGAAAERFLLDLGSARALLAPLLDESAEAGKRATEYRIDFRTDRDREVGGEEIVDWQVAVGGQPASFGQDAGRRSGEWHIGDRAGISLTWASESSRRPTWGGEASVMQGRTVAWAYVGPWAFLRLVVDHRETRRVGDSRVPVRDGGVLNLRVTTSGTGQDVPEAGVEATAGETSVFVEIVFLGPTGAGEREVPVFPREAPRLPPAATRR